MEIRQSPGKGRGVFARRDLPKGYVIERAPVLIVPVADADQLLAGFLKHYIFQTDDGLHYVVGLGWASIINHADKSNCEFFVTNDAITMRATRRIPAGKEVTVDYGWNKAEWAEITKRP